MPLTVDLSWPEPQEYQGSNPRPDDFEVYWDAVAELDALESGRRSSCRNSAHLRTL